MRYNFITLSDLKRYDKYNATVFSRTLYRLQKNISDTLAPKRVPELNAEFLH